jgi:uncharacterized lipoprotein YddW (UPF0748 family)
VILVQATSSAPSEAERSYAAKITARMAVWLEESGIPSTLVTDDQLGLLQKMNGRVVILPDNPLPGRKQLAALQLFIKNGGKLIVFFASEPKLADMMGLRLGARASSPGTDSWAAFRFGEGAPAGTPDRIEQASQTLWTVYPGDNNATVIAWWESASGKRTREPAWIKSAHGFWMSHILLESDVAAKKQLLVSLLGACDGDLWKAAATHTVNHAGTLDLYPDAAQAIAAIRATSGQGGQAAEVTALLARADHLQETMIGEFKTGRYPRVLETARQLDRTLTEAYARTQSTRRGEFRGAWNHSGTGFTPGNWEASCATLARNGLTAILPNVQRPWCAHYPSQLIPASDTLTRYGDQMSACLAAARRHGLETHAWVILWSMEGAPDALIARYRRAGRLQVSSSGTPVSWLCPSNPENRTFELAALRDLVTRYPSLDGVQLDYIRYKSSDTCYCAGCRTRFTRETGIRVNRWPAEVRTGSKTAAYRQWRREQISRFVADAHREITAIKPGIKLSASVYAGYPGCADSIAQDWAAWLRNGWVDFVCPMNYTADSTKFSEWYRTQTSYPGVRGKLFAGIGVTSLECRLNAVETIHQINRLRREGATGFTLFEANPTLRDDILPYLGMGATAL